jgi:predicted RNA-binding Zn-ribbon protein involved in translation (DUF1610 family)
MVNSPNKCPNCGYKDPLLGLKSHHVSQNMHKTSQKHPVFAGAMLAVLAAKKVGLVPDKCPKCGTQYWIGGRIGGQ